MPCPKDYARVAKNGRAFAGSQKQIQIYVNEREAEFSKRIKEVLKPSVAADATVRWVSPLANRNFDEYRDLEFLEKLGLSTHSEKLNSFWPTRGPCWDALAVVEGTNPRGVVLIEAKSHISEMESKCGAKSSRSLQKIREALALTAQSLGVGMNASWMENYYQTANRYAHLRFLHNVGVPAWLVNVYFMNDQSIKHIEPPPRSADEWHESLKQVKKRMGIDKISVPFTADLFIDVRP